MGQGDVDHAKNVATFVPGIGTTVEGSTVEYMRQTQNLRSAAMAQGSLALSDVATVAWLGYDAPGEFDWKKHPEDVPGIISPFLAQAGSDRLVGFMNGMQASRDYGAGDTIRMPPKVSCLISTLITTVSIWKTAPKRFRISVVLLRG